MLATPKFLAYMAEQGFGPFIGVPCSFLKPFINYVIEHNGSEYIAANNEGEAVAIASGAWLAGRKPVVMFQNSGLGNAVSPLTSLNYVFHIPLLLITTWRGEPGTKDEPQHELMGRITCPLLDCLGIPHELFPEEDDQLEPRLSKAIGTLESTRLPYALVMRKGAVSGFSLKAGSGGGSVGIGSGRTPQSEPAAASLMLRSQAVERIADTADPSSLLIATTGGTARELCIARDRAANFYVVGSMGCASSLALGVAMQAPGRPVVVLDGDGAALMRLEAMVSVGHFKPSNFVHIVLDNEVYDSTGGQKTLSGSVDFPAVALACGYQTAASASSAEGLEGFLRRAQTAAGPHLIHVKIRPGSDPNLGRPSLSPPEMAARFRQEILGHE
jgi:phosphonopyruvate decarboxylase